MKSSFKISSNYNINTSNCPYIYQYINSNKVYVESNGMVMQIEESLENAIAEFNNNDIILIPARFSNPDFKNRTDNSVGINYYLNPCHYHKTIDSDGILTLTNTSKLLNKFKAMKPDFSGALIMQDAANNHDNMESDLVAAFE